MKDEQVYVQVEVDFTIRVTFVPKRNDCHVGAFPSLMRPATISFTAALRSR